MESLTIKGQNGDSSLYIGEDHRNFKQYLPKGFTVVITDTTVEALYGKAFADYPIITIGQTEQNKTFETVQHLIDELVQLEADRKTFILAVGGGLVCDLAGFVASIYLRGVSFGFISTTLLSQVDASVGGKNGINFKGFKNMIGVFNQPEFVICDAAQLKTLSKTELLSGFGEVIKHALIADEQMVSFLESKCHKALELNPEVMEKIISHSIHTKAAIVNKDEKEQGERRKLNFGHTYGHAVEKVLGLPHGLAISLGMVVAAKLSVMEGLLTKDEEQRVIHLLKMYGLPTQIKQKHEEILTALAMDKKREGEQIHFVLLDKIGNAVIRPIHINKLQEIRL